MNNKKIIAAALLTLTIQFAASQNNTNSPYTRFGYGDISEGAATELRGMGSVSLGNRSINTINSVNPASYSSVDSLSFMFDVGAGIRFSRFSDTHNSNKTLNANLEYITMRFPIGRWIGFSAGLLPYSVVGYNFGHSDSILMNRNPSEDKKMVQYNTSFTGAGGLSQIYAGLSANLFRHISVGVNTYYLFGEISNYRTLSFRESSSGFSPSLYTNQLKVTDFRLRYGVQLYNTFAKKHDVTLGLIYENKNKLKGTFNATLNGDTLATNNGFELPQTFGAGLNYTFNKQLTLGVDFMRQNWGSALFFHRTDSLNNISKFAFGAEYIPDPMSRKYADQVRYRVGFRTNNQYYKLGQGIKQPNDMIFSFGVGLPMRTGKTVMNLALEYGKIGSASALREDYLKLTFSTSINEYWFFKPKL